ncbi:LysR family transcriptional regulator [Oceanobacillus sp. CFH 90083]|uniref:LysR family transcriptional regulator n=1 Tax=Oceanobacillus sp. CFH 90083 TaxID=2592336 RepID=UPI00128E8022|nr:LysR family transcriptional regulator [Oceanobacillus sp. CFH 90083]
MDQKDWVLLKTLYEERNMTRTAAKLYVSQPSLSYRLKNLEADLGVALFFKTNKGIEFTSEGEYLVQYSIEMLKQFQFMKDTMSNMEEDVSGTLRIGVSSNFAQYLLPRMLKDFSKNYPNVRFNVQTGWSTQVIEFLNNSSVHVGILRNIREWHGEKILIKKEPLYLISKKKVKMEHLPEYRLINYNTDSSLKESITTWWADQFAEPANIEMEVDRLETCKEMVKNDFGFAIVPGICLEKEDDLYQQAIYLKDGTPVIRETWLVFNPSFEKLTVVNQFVNYMKKWKEND